jgi:hypothetical protein
MNQEIYIKYPEVSDVIIPAALGPKVYSASNINEYQKRKKMILGSRA